MLNIFSPNLSNALHQNEIDSPNNAITLSANLHKRFGRCDLIFEEIERADDNDPIEYQIKSLVQSRFDIKPGTNTNRMRFFDHSKDGIPLPNPYLLKIHASVGKLIYFSAHAEYIDSVLREWEVGHVLGDGCTNLGELVALQLLVSPSLLSENPDEAR